ncbi:hypothetical protein ACFLYY_01895 [Patescibacteria group bacterium]
MKIIKITLLILLIIILFLLGYFFIGDPKPLENIIWGVNFSQKYTQNLGLDWRETYLALLDDLGAKKLKIAAHWNLIQPEINKFYFDDLDWQINEVENRGGKILLVIGMKTPRWPECHIPEWAKGFSKKEQQEEILNMLETIVLRYKDSKAIWGWQVENEPFFSFGECPWVDNEFLKKEISLVKSLDFAKRPIVISESGEFPLWISAAQYGDMVGVTMYKKVWFHQIGVYITYPFSPAFYYRKADIVRNFFGKEVICVELQTEPWTEAFITNTSLEEQKKTMNLIQFKENIEFAKKTGIGEFYLWGGEWMYWMKEKQDRPEIWNEAKKLFIRN